MKTNKNKPQTAEQTAERASFTDVLREYEQTVASGADSTRALLTLSQAVAYSVLNTCLDPQRKTAAERDAVSDNGLNPALVSVRRGIAADMALLDTLDSINTAAPVPAFDSDGNFTPADLEYYGAECETLTDGIDLVQTAALAILEQTAEHSGDVGWMETPYTVRRIDRRVYIQSKASAKYKDVETTPIQEVYRAVRLAVQDSRAMQTDPRNGYTYIEDMTADPETGALETIYRRLGKYADLGGAVTDYNGKVTAYTADEQTVADYERIVAALALTDRQQTVISLRMRGYGYKAIASYLGVTQRAVAKTVDGIQKKARAAGLKPADK